MMTDLARKGLHPFTEWIEIPGQGAIQLVDVLGGDMSVVNAARTTSGISGDHEFVEGVCKHCGISEMAEIRSPTCRNRNRKLIRYLMAHRHTTPFEFAEIVLNIRLPMDTWRQWVRHRTASINEHSTRYSPPVEGNSRVVTGQWRAQAKSNRQGSSGLVTAHPESDHMVRVGVPEDPQAFLSAQEAALQQAAKDVYDTRIRYGVAKELARKDLLLSQMTQVQWKMDLHNLLHFLALRLDPHAQQEIRQFAEAIAEIVKVWVPMTWEAFVDYRLEACSFSRMEMDALHRILRLLKAQEAPRVMTEGMTPREIRAFNAKLGLSNG